jgi:UDP-N-acetylglucosamine 1-carboxyvinyltransferase
LPGGCAIGTRAIDQHLKGFEALGATITIGQGFIQAQADGTLKGAKIYLDIASVGATENIMMAAALAEGTTTIENAAKEPEITDLANIMNLMGANVRGAGTDTIRIEGVERLHGVEYTVIPDRIEAGTYMIAAAITGSDIHVEGAIIEHLVSLVAKLTEMGVEVEPTDDGVYVRASGRSLKSVDIKTLPYPGFPTDLQAQMMALLLKASGASVVTEMLFENRYMHVQEFRKMNAQIKVDGRSAFIVGGSELSPAKLIASDLRAAAALILIALATEGETEITGLQHLDRGYVDIVGKLSALGADIVRLTPAEVEMQELRGQALHGQSPHLRIVN